MKNIRLTPRPLLVGSLGFLFAISALADPGHKLPEGMKEGSQLAQLWAAADHLEDGGAKKEAEALRKSLLSSISKSTEATKASAGATTETPKAAEPAKAVATKTTEATGEASKADAAKATAGASKPARKPAAVAVSPPIQITRSEVTESTGAAKTSQEPKKVAIVDSADATDITSEAKAAVAAKTGEAKEIAAKITEVKPVDAAAAKVESGAKESAKAVGLLAGGVQQTTDKAGAAPKVTAEAVKEVEKTVPVTGGETKEVATKAVEAKTAAETEAKHGHSHDASSKSGSKAVAATEGADVARLPRALEV